MVTMTGCDSGDFQCYCKNDQFITSITGCIGKECTSEKDKESKAFTSC